MANLLLDIANYLVSKGLAIADGVDIFRDFSPDKPDDCIILNEYSGPPTPDGVDAVERDVQVVVRSVEAADARSKCWSIFNEIDKPTNRIIYFTESRWAIVYAKQTPFRMGTDVNNRVLYAFNVGIATYRD